MGNPIDPTAWTEDDLLRHVREWAEQFDWLCYHSWSSQHSPAGFPDLVLVRDDRVIFAELKSAQGKLSTAQRQWIDALHMAEDNQRIEVYIWRPADFQEILNILR